MKHIMNQSIFKRYMNNT